MASCKHTIYRLLMRPQGFGVEALQNEELPFQWRSYTLKKIKGGIIENRYRLDDASALDLSILVLSLGGKSAYNFFDLASESRSRNLTYEPVRAFRLLRDFFDLHIGKTETPKVKEKKRMDLKRLENLCSAAFAPVREKLGWGESLSVEESYHITDDVIAAASSDESKDYLDRKATLYPHIFPHRLHAIASELAQDYPDEAENILKMLKQTKTRNHFASLSLTDIQGELMVCLANHHRDCLRVEAWKFVLLLEDPKEPKMLARLERLDYREKRTPFLFNEHSKGDVHAMFYPQTSTIRVICKREEDKIPGEQATFVIDPDYALSLYLLLTRMRQDKDQFARLWEEATVKPETNLFDSLYIQD